MADYICTLAVVSVGWLTNRFHVAVLQFSDKSCPDVKNVVGTKEESPKPSGECITIFLSHFDVICDLLQNRRTATWNLCVS